MAGIYHIGFDISTSSTGYAIYKELKSGTRYYESGFIAPEGDKFEDRFHEMGTALINLIWKYKPASIVYEQEFKGKGLTNLLNVCKVQGIVDYTARNFTNEINEIAISSWRSIMEFPGSKAIGDYLLELGKKDYEKASIATKRDYKSAELKAIAIEKAKIITGKDITVHDEADAVCVVTASLFNRGILKEIPQKALDIDFVPIEIKERKTHERLERNCKK